MTAIAGHNNNFANKQKKKSSALTSNSQVCIFRPVVGS